jgi:hypothetical protein
VRYMESKEVRRVESDGHGRSSRAYCGTCVCACVVCA